MLVGHPNAAFGSYQATHGTVRPAPAKSIDGDSASAVGSTLRDAGKPWVTQAPFLKARTKICWLSPVFCSNVAHGTWTLPAVSVPPATSETPAFWFGSIALATSLFTCEPLAGSGRKAARAAGPASSTPTAARPAIVSRRRRARAVTSEGRDCMRRSSYWGLSAGAPGPSMPSRFGPQELIVGNATSEPRGRMHVARGDTASTARSMSTLAAASPNRDVIYVGRSDLRIDTAGSVVPADVTVDLSPLRDRPDRCVCEHPSGALLETLRRVPGNTASGFSRRCFSSTPSRNGSAAASARHRSNGSTAWS